VSNYFPNYHPHNLDQSDLFLVFLILRFPPLPTFQAPSGLPLPPVPSTFPPHTPQTFRLSSAALRLRLHMPETFFFPPPCNLGYPRIFSPTPPEFPPFPSRSPLRNSGYSMKLLPPLPTKNPVPLLFSSPTSNIGRYLFLPL